MNDIRDAITRARVVASPVGPLTITASSYGVRAVLWPDDDADRVPSAFAPETNAEAPAGSSDAASDAVLDAVLDSVEQQLGEYFVGDRTEFDLALDAVGTEFQHAAWAALRRIPFAATASYGEQAEWMGDSNKARAVGAANGRNPISIIVPCHRVVGANGSLTGFAGGVETKQWLLAHEQKVAGHTLL